MAQTPDHVPPHRLVPIRTLDGEQRGAVQAHLLGLGPADRYLRFGYAANDEQVTRYVQGLAFDRDVVFGVFNRRLDLIAMAHLAFALDPNCANCAEFGVSVSQHARGRGYGRRLFERSVVHARNDGVELLFIHALSENRAMLHIARQGGAVVVRDGSESQAHLRLPPADFESHVQALVDEQVARTDYQLKRQSQQFWRVLHGLQALRWGSGNNGQV
ncbi:MAG: hypothetical protein RJA09_2642 [Pseudomonadota bacterium]|jgi:GNAT superfamily N-acetyltransferase